MRKWILKTLNYKTIKAKIFLKAKIDSIKRRVHRRYLTENKLLTAKLSLHNLFPICNFNEAIVVMGLMHH